MRILLLLLFYTSAFFAQNTREDVYVFQDNLKAFYLNEETTPLTKEELANFIGIQFYPYSEDYIVEAKVEYLKKQPVFKMISTGSKQQDYKRFALLHFELFGQKHTLEVYQNIALSQKKGYEDSYFLPFLDYSNGETTSEVGRYIDLKIPKKAKKIILNFNYAYHPYCAYTHGYSCPITPSVNSINQAIDAGVKY
ncbi:DUF1684 domain-containing protein [Flavobacterium sp. xlx-214]|uniref:DUF1684 domain-containing protein n=1 Tax=unclassified Flavobacterium TaxID=196869 RepID=UPI0013D7F54B|nr:MULTISPECIES: DUF1684 domain-containing protein [unclassified Flavobacterium]MBA5791846.1 DUF1684 domain-containing protein [Flavobacterium sp. xlx-221]QMI83083.1 DUF1684 domain-containing protein [Flavobacterium sp. xlx-214]